MEEAWTMAMSSVIALSIGGLAAILGLWIGRDKSRPVGFAIAMTVLIGSAVGVGIVQSVLDAEESIKKQADLDRMVDTVTEIAIASGDTELAALIEAQVGTRVEIPEPLPEEEAAEAEPDAVDGEEAVEGDLVEGEAVEGEVVEGDAAAAPTEGDAAPTQGAAAPATEQE